MDEYGKEKENDLILFMDNCQWLKCVVYSRELYVQEL